MLLPSHFQLEPSNSNSRTRVPAGGINLIASIDFKSDESTTVTLSSSTKVSQGDDAISRAQVATPNHSNQQFSIYAITDVAASIVARYAYTAYGQPTILNAAATVIATSAISNRYTYTAREWDATVGLYHFRARWMSGLTGRFLSRDPIGYKGGISLYGNFFGQADTDPLGLRKVCCKFRYGWLITDYTTQEIDCDQGKSAGTCCKDFGGFPSLWGVEGASDQPCDRVKDPVQKCLLKPVTTVTTVTTNTVQCGKTVVTTHPVVRVVLTLACVNEYYVNNDPNIYIPDPKNNEDDPCWGDYQACLLTAMSDWGGKQANRCWNCYLGCRARGGWFRRMNGLRCDYWNTEALPSL